MPTDLALHQHELLYPSGASALVFGTEDTGYLTTSAPAFENGDGTVGDIDRPREDGRALGEDYLGAKTYTFELAVLTPTTVPKDQQLAANLTAVSAIEGAWNDPRFRSDSTTVGVLRSNASGTVYRAYGRPRGFQEVSGQYAAKGYTTATCGFALADATWYSDTESLETVSIQPPTNPGLIGPLVDPLTTAPVTNRDGTMVVGGSTYTWPRVKIYCPVTNPSVKIGDLKIGLRGTIPAGKHVTLDPRPWARTVLRNDGANYAGYLTAATPVMRLWRLAPGAYALGFGGIDQDFSGTARAEFYWREARTRP